MTYGLGIDLGTTFSAAAISDANGVRIFPLGGRSATIPSVVAVREHGEVLVGEAAERRALTEPARTAREFKRRLGDPTPIFLGGVPYGAESLTAHLLRAIVESVVEREAGAPARIALTRPASYRIRDAHRSACHRNDRGLAARCQVGRHDDGRCGRDPAGRRHVEHSVDPPTRPRGDGTAGRARRGSEAQRVIGGCPTRRTTRCARTRLAAAANRCRAAANHAADHGDAHGNVHGNFRRFAPLGARIYESILQQTH